MQKLWRRELAKAPLVYNNSISGIYILDADKKTQSQFVDDISKSLKIFKRKQELYFKIVETLQQHGLTNLNSQGCSSAQTQVLKTEHEKNLAEQLSAMANLQGYHDQPFSQSKTQIIGQISYLYTVFMRIGEVLQASKQKAKLHTNKQLQKTLDQHKIKLHQCYQNQTNIGKFDVTMVIDVARNAQNDRINKLIPRKKVPFHKPPPPVFEIERVKSLQSRQDKRKCNSHIWSNKFNLVASKKLIGNNHSKELSSAHSKKKAQPKVNSFSLLYKSLGVKLIKIDEFSSTKWQIYQQILQRNRSIIEDRRKWEKEYQCQVKGFRSKLKGRPQDKK